MDECGVDYDMCHRKYGRTQNRKDRPKKVRKYTSKRRANLISTIRLNEVVNFCVTEGTTNTNTFNDYILGTISLLPIGSVLVIDNALFHKCSVLHTAVEVLGRHLLFLPPYSPDLNLIEISYGWLKKSLRQNLIGTTTFEDLITRIANIYSQITSVLCTAWYERCFYLEDRIEFIPI